MVGPRGDGALYHDAAPTTHVAGSIEGFQHGGRDGLGDSDRRQPAPVAVVQHEPASTPSGRLRSLARRVSLLLFPKVFSSLLCSGTMLRRPSASPENRREEGCSSTAVP